MSKLSALSAAIAAGVMSIAVGTAHSASLNPRMDHDLDATLKVVDKTPDAKKSSKPVTARNMPLSPRMDRGQSVAPKTVAKAPKTVAKAKKSDPAKSKTAKSKKNTRTAKSKKSTKPKIDQTKTASISSKRAGKDRRYSKIIARYAASYGVPVSLAHAVIKIESNYRPKARGSAGEIGLMQIKPSTARMMGYSGSTKGLYSPETNIKYGMKYLAMARDLGGGTTCGTILKYNAGHAAKRMNPVSSAYCSKVKVQLAALGSPA